MDFAGMKFPIWVRKGDGRLESFDAEKIHRAIFAAAQALGVADAFLCRELTDGVLHFLPQETDAAEVSSLLIRDVAVKVVRELGHARLAEVLAGQGGEGGLPASAVAEASGAAAVRQPVTAGVSPETTSGAEQSLGPSAEAVERWLAQRLPPHQFQQQTAAAVLERFSRQMLCPPSLVAAEREELCTLGGLHWPRELTAAVMRLLPSGETADRSSGNGFEPIAQARQYVGGTIAYDSPDHELAHWGLRVGELPRFLLEMEFAARTYGLQVEVNLGSETPPHWAGELSTGPLFEAFRLGDHRERLAGHLAGLAEHLAALPPAAALRLNWHLSARDFQNASDRARLGRLLRAALAGAPITFCCDRPNQSTLLADGLSRDCPAIIQWIGLNLPALLERPALRNPAGFAQGVLRLARLAASAGVQKRDFIQRYGLPGRPPFLLEQARVGLYLIGLPAAVEKLFVAPLGDSHAAQEFVHGLLRDLNAAIDKESVLMPIRGVLAEVPTGGGSLYQSLSTSRGGRKDWRALIQLADRWHAVNRRGLVSLPVDQEFVPDPLRMVESLHFAWKQTNVQRIRFERTPRWQTQFASA